MDIADFLMKNQETKRVVRVRDSQEMDLPEDGIPDTERPRGMCPHCGLQSSFEPCPRPMPVLQQERDRVHGMQINHHVLQRVVSLICQGCSQGVVVIEENYLDVDEQEKKARPFGYYRGIYHWPLATANVSSDVPDGIANVFAEAVQAVAARLPRAAAILARATLDAITLDKGEPANKPLAKRLENMATRNALQPELAEWATEVRLIGNESAHDPKAQVELKDAEQLIAFERELLRYLYEMPAELARRRVARIP